MSGDVSMISDPGVRAVPVRKRNGAEVSDLVAVEAPLEIRVGGRPLVITMRTPGHDEELAAGFLFAEGVVTSGKQIESIRTEAATGMSDRAELAAGTVGSGDRVLVELRGAPDAEAVERAQRDFRATAACGVCGKESLEDLDQALPTIARVECATDLLDRLPDRMRPHQTLFAATGGIHAAGLFTLMGELLCVREDIGRHNAVDKVIGRAVLDGATSLADRILLGPSPSGQDYVRSVDDSAARRRRCRSRCASRWGTPPSRHDRQYRR